MSGAPGTEPAVAAPAARRELGTALVVAAGLAVHLLLAAGALGVLPPATRLALAFGVLVLLPGYAFVALGATPPGGAWLAPGWAFGFGVAWNAALVLATRALGLPFTVLVGWSAAATAAVWAAVGWRHRATPPDPPAPALPAAAVLAVALAVAVIGAYLIWVGPVLSFYSDAPDHIGTLRRMMASGDAVPSDAFFRDAGAAGVDPRKGLWHPQLAVIALLSGVDALQAWSGLPPLIAVLFVLNAASFGRLLAGGAGAGVAAWALILTYGGTLAAPGLRHALFSSRVADQLALATTVAVIADLQAPRRATRLAAIGLGLAAVTTHLFGIIQFGVAFATLGAGLVLRDRGVSAPVRRLAGTATLLAATALPFLLWRLSHAYAPTNIIHTEPQGLVWLTGNLRVVSPGVLSDSMFWGWVLFPFAWWPLWRHGRGNPASLFILTSSVAAAVFLFVPPVVMLLEPRLGYLLMRMAGLASLYGLLAWAVPGLWMRIVRRGERRVRLQAAAALVGVLLVMAPNLRDAELVGSRPEILAADDRESPLLWEDALQWMDAHLPVGSVVLADPFTSYSIPMMTRLYVATLVDQHSSPNDSLALTRILDARDGLDPYGSWDRLRAVVARYDVTAIALNDRFAVPPRGDYWAPSPEWYARARARLDRHPVAFEPVFDTGDFVVYRVHRAAVDTLSGAPPERPFVSAWRSGAFPAGRRMGEGMPVLHGLVVWPHVVAPGDTVHAVAVWRALRPATPGSYSVVVRLDRPLPGGLRPPSVIGKPVRKLIERLRGERYRLRSDHLPLGGAYGVDLWRAEEVVRDSFELVIPSVAAEGRYELRIKMMRQPHYHNLRLSDYFLDEDVFSGLPAGWVEVERPGTAKGAAAVAAEGRRGAGPGTGVAGAR